MKTGSNPSEMVRDSRIESSRVNLKNVDSKPILEEMELSHEE